MSQPRNVTPGHEDDFEPGTFPNSGPGDRSTGIPPEWTGWAWSATRDRAFPWLGLLLVMVGAGLLLDYLVPALSLTTIVLGAITVSLLAVWLMGGVRFALIPALLIGALVVARLIHELNIYTGPGTTSFALAAAFAIIWLMGQARQPRNNSVWALWGVAIFGLIGIASISSSVIRIPELGGMWPVVIIVVGLFIVFGNGRRRRCP